MRGSAPTTCSVPTRFADTGAGNVRPMARLTLIGGGRMGEALLAGLLAPGGPAAELAVVEKLAARRSELDRSGSPAWSSPAEPVAADGAVVAVKPSDVDGRLPSRRGSRRRAGAVDRRRRAARPARGRPSAPGIAVVRAMPNTPALVGAGAAAIAGGTAADDDDLAWAECDPRRGRHGRPGARERCSTRSPGCPGRARPTCSSWPRRSSTPACWPACPATSASPSPPRPCSARPGCWPRPARRPRRSGPRSPRPAARPPPGLRVLEARGPCGPRSSTRSTPPPSAPSELGSRARASPLATPTTGAYSRHSGEGVVHGAAVVAGPVPDGGRGGGPRCGCRR